MRKQSVQIKDFDLVVNDITSGNKKFKTNDYLIHGEFPIIDQGSEYIAGFTNEDKVVQRNKDVIVFGDHTKNLKYVDFDFCLGADGTKVLEPKDGLDTKYLYYFLRTRKIPNVGYSRHFKYLKRTQIPLPPIETQKSIAARLDRAESVKHLNRQLLEKYDELAQAVFLEMFGDPVVNEKGWEVKKLGELCYKIGSGATPRGGKESYKKEGIPLIRSLNIHDDKFKYQDLAFIDDEQAYQLRNVIVKKNDVLFNITGASVCRAAIIPNELVPARVNQHVAILRCKTKIIIPKYLLAFLISPTKKMELLHLSKTGGATREAINKGQLEALEIKVPPLSLQTEFARRIENIEHQKSLLRLEMAKSEELFESLLQESFSPL